MNKYTARFALLCGIIIALASLIALKSWLPHASEQKESSIVDDTITVEPKPEAQTTPVIINEEIIEQEIAPETALQEEPITISKAPHDRSAYKIGFTSIDGEFKLKKVPTTGSVPRWLNGSLFFVGPGKFEVKDSKAQTWLDGFAMIHRFSFKDGNVSYANKFLETKYYNDSISQGVMSTAASAADPNASYFSKLAAAMSSNDKPPYDNTNINIVCHNHCLLACTETAQPVQFERRTLKTKGLVCFDDKHKPHVASAHPYTDPQSGELIGCMTTYGRKSSYNVYTMNPKSFERIPLTTITTSYPSYMHSFAVTPHYIILVEVPFVVNPYDIAMSGKPYLENFTWKPQQGTLLTVIDRATGNMINTYKIEPFFMLNQINAFEKNGSIVIDLAAHENSAIMKSYHLLDIACEKDHYFPHARMKRITIDLKQDAVQSIWLNNSFIEMPRINNAYKTQPYTFVYAIGSQSGREYYNQIKKININTQAELVWQEPSCFVSEPVFVAAPHAKSEDDGVVMSIVLDGTTQKSFLLILDAHTFKELARVKLNHHIPFIVHGIFLPRPTSLKAQIEEQIKK